MAYKTREKLIEVARQLYAYKGPDNITMSDIAHASDKGRRTIYTYFRNKKEIYAAVLESESDNMIKSLKDVVESRIPADEKLRLFLKLHFSKDSAPSKSYGMVRSLIKFDLRRNEKVRRMVLDKECAMVKEILDQGIDESLFDRNQAERLQKFLMACIQGLILVDGQQAEREEQTERVAYDDFIDFVISSITANNPQINNKQL